MITQEMIDEKASDIIDYIQDACGEVGYECGNPKNFHYQDPDMQKKILKAKKNGVTDVTGWLADEYYDDVNFLQDFAGDRIHDGVTELGFKGEYKEKKNYMIKIAEAMKEYGHNSLKKAMDNLIKGWKK